MTAVQNTDYASAKSALSTFFDALRQECILESKPIFITNVYPYIIDTQLFAGFNGFALNLIAPLKKAAVAEGVFEAAFRNGLEEVYLPWYTYWLGIGMLIIRPFSERLRIWIIQSLMGNGMKGLRKKND